MAVIGPKLPVKTQEGEIDPTKKSRVVPKRLTPGSTLPVPAQEQAKTDSYDEGYTQGYGSRADYRAANQSGFQMWRNALTQGVSEATLGALEGVGYLADLDQWGHIITGGEKEFTNWFSDAMKSGKEGIAEFAPVNQTENAQHNFAPEDPTWWAGNTPSIFSALSLLIPTEAAVETAGALGKSLGAGSKFLTSKIGQGLAKGVTGAVISRYMENTMEAGDSYKQAYQLGIQGGMSDTDAKATASDAASKTWYGNLANLGTDIFQYIMLAGGFKGIKGPLALVTTMASEGLEEAGQSVVSQEAIHSAFTNTDFFGKGFSDRLSDYIEDPGFKTSAFFGALGGAVFHAGGSLYRPSSEKLADEALAKKRAEAIGDVETIQKLKDLTFTRLAIDHLAKGKTDKLREDLETMQQEADIDPKVRDGISKHLKNLDFLESQYDKVAGNKSLPEELLFPILATQLDYRQTSEMLHDLKKKGTQLVSETSSNGELNPTLTRAKELIHTIHAYDNLQAKSGVDFSKERGIYKEALAFEQKAFKDNKENKDKELYKEVVTSADPTIQDIFDKMIAQQERHNRIKEDLHSLTSPEGVANFKSLQETRAAETEARKTLANPTSTVDQLLEAVRVTKDPELKDKLVAKAQAMQETAKAGNKEKTADIANQAKVKKVEEKKKEVSSIQPKIETKVEPKPFDVKFDDPSIIDDLDVVFGPAKNAADVVQGVEDVNVPPGTKASGQISLDENGELVLERLQDEKDPKEITPTQSTGKIEKEQSTPVTVIVDKGAKTVLKEIAGKYDDKGIFIPELNPDTTPKKQSYYYAEDTAKSNPVKVENIFDATNGVLTINTPAVKIGDKVVIKTDAKWPFFKTSDPESIVMNVYAVNSEGKTVGKPLTQIPSSKNEKTSTPASNILRRLVNRSQGTPVYTTVTYKNYGDLLSLRTEDGHRLQNSIEVLESDMIQVGNEWKLAKTPYNPILGYVNSSRIVQVPGINLMKGVDKAVLDRVGSMEAITKGLPGTTMVLRTDPKGSFSFAQIDPRTLVQEEVDWLKANLAPYLADKRYSDLKNIIHIENIKISDDLADYNEDNRLVNIAGDIAFFVKGEKNNYWVKINATGKFAENFSNFMNGTDYKFQVFTREGIKYKDLQDSSLISPIVREEIQKSFDNLLSSQFKNIDKNFLNTENTYADVTGKEYPSYYDYLKETSSVSTDLPEGYSFFNATIYLDTNGKTSTEATVNPATKEVVPSTKPDIEQTIITPKESTTKPSPKKKKIDWDRLASEGEEERYRLLGTPVAPFRVMSDRELSWMQTAFGNEYLSIAEGVDRVISTGGLEAYGYYHNAMISLAQLSEEGSGYHEAFHFVMLTQLSFPQQEKIIAEAARKYGKSKNRLELEEALAEDFRRYMLADGKYEPEVLSSRSLFRRILDYIKKALGFKSSIERLFENVAAFRVTPDISAQLQIKRSLAPLEDFEDLRHRLIPGFSWSNQQIEALNATTHRLLEKAMNLAGEDGSYDDILTVPVNLERFLVEIKAEYEASLVEINKQKKDIEDGTLDLSDTELRDLAAKGKTLRAIVQNWNDVTTGPNKIEGYQTQLVKNLGKYGFTVTVRETKAKSSEDAAEDFNESDEVLAEDPSSQERVFGMSFLIQSPIKTLSGKIKRFLATIPEYDNNNKPVLTIFGTPKYIEFNRIYANLSSKLAGHRDIFNRLGELAIDNPVLAAVKTRLDTHLEKGQLSIDSIPAQFYTAFNKSNYKFFTTLVGYENGTPTARVIETDRRNIERTLIQDWRTVGVKRSLIDTEGKPNVKKVAALKKTLDSLLPERKNLSYDQMKSSLTELLHESGITLPTQVWQELDNSGTRRTDIAQLLFGEKAPSMEAFLNYASEGNDPFEQTGLLTELARRSKDYVEDLQAKTFINEKGNQVSAINLNTPVTDLINKLSDETTGAEQIEILEQDKFYRGNQFLTTLKNPKTRKQAVVNIFSAFRGAQNGEPKEYSDTTVQDSFVSRLTAWFDSNNPISGYIYVGTLSDKSQQLAIRLPKKNGNASKSFLKDVLRTTMKQEIARIQRLKAHLKGDSDNKAFTPNDIATYGTRGLTFQYIPELNSIPNLAESLSNGDLDPAVIKNLNDQADIAIEVFIKREEDAYLKKLEDLGLIKQESGIYLNVGLPEVFEETGVTRLVKEFFHNDFAWRLEMSKVFHGDLAYYKNAATYFKRGYQIITPGLQGYVNPKIKSAGQKTTYRRGIFQSSIKENSDEYLLSLAKLIDPKVTSLSDGSRASKIANSYKKINKTDAQGYVTISAYRDILLSVGQWTNDHEFFYEHAWKSGKSIKGAVMFSKLSDRDKSGYSAKEAEILLQPLKPFTFGDRIIKLSDGSTMVLKEQFKESLTPLLPEWVNRHTQLRPLLEAMNRDGIDIMSDSEAVKVGSYAVNTDLEQPIIGRDVAAENMRFPFFIPEKAKREILAGTQIEKLIVGNIDPKTKYSLEDKEVSGADIIQEYHNTWADIIKEDYDSFKDLFGLDDTLRVPESQKLDFLTKLKKVLEDELSHRELPDPYIDSLKIIHNKLNQPEFLVGLDFPALGKKYEQVLTNLFKKYLLTQKLPGDSLVNLADYGNPQVEVNSELKFITNEDGKLIEAEVGLPERHVRGLGIRRDTHFDSTTGKIKWDTLSDLQKQGLQMIIYRIPTQGKNSMLPVRVATVFPDSSGSVIMVPGEGTKQGGFDFDVDKSYLMKRTVEKGKIPATSANKLFDIHWSILTNSAHTEELLNPLDSAVHDEMIDYLEQKGVVTRNVNNSPFSATTDMEMEKLAKYSKAMIGVFSKFSVAHATLQSIKDKVRIKVPIAIVNPSYKYNEVGRTRDDKDILISDNHSAQQNSALDAQKDPKLGYLNITTFNASTLAYMTDLGVNQKLALAFMNQPILRELADTYFRNGDNDIENATETLIQKYTGLGNLLEDTKKTRITPITAKNIDTNLTVPIDRNLHHQAQILADFKKYYYAAQDMNKVNTALSADTVRDMTSIAAVQGYIDIVEHVTGEKSTVRINPDVFVLSKSPVKRVAGFYNYGIRAALQFTKQFYAYNSDVFNRVRNYIAGTNLQKNGKLRDVELITQVNQAMTYTMLGEEKALDSSLAKISPNYGSRWSYFLPSKSLAVHMEKIKEKHPKLKKNLFLQALKAENNKKSQVQLVGINNTHGNFNKTNLSNAWNDLLHDPNPEIKLLGNDLIRYAVQTTGFKTTTNGFVDLVPPEIWRESGLAAYHSSLTEAYNDSAKTVNVPSVAKVIVRHLFSSSKLVKSIPFKLDADGNMITSVSKVVRTDNKGTHVTEFVATKNSGLYDESSDIEWAHYAKMYDKKAQKWRLYEQQNSGEDMATYREIQPLGEPGRYVQYTSNGDEPSNHPAHSGLKSFYLENQNEATPQLIDNSEVYKTLGLDKRMSTAGDVLTKLKASEKDLKKLGLIDKLLTHVDKLGGTKLVVEKSIHLGEYDPLANEIYISPSIESQEELNHVALHELIHAYTVKAIGSPTTPDEANFKQAVSRVLEDVKKYVPATEYGLKGPEEFMAELASNKSFRDKVRKKPGIWERVVRAIRRIFGLNDSYDQVIIQLYKVLDSSSHLTEKNGEKFYLEKKSELKQLFSRVLKSLEKRTERLFRQGENYKITEKLSAELTKLEDKQALIKYVRYVIDQVSDLGRDINSTLKESKQVTAAKLRSYTEQLNSYKVLNPIRDYVQTHPEEYAELGRENKNILQALDEVLSNIRNLNTAIDNASLDVVATWVKNNTQQDLTLDHIKQQLRVADRDVTIINRGLDAIVNSRDEVLRIIGKQVINAKAAAYRKTEHLLKTSWLDTNQKYEAWLKEQGINVNDQKSRNTPILDPKSLDKNSTSVLFASPGSEQYDKIMAYPKDHPLRTYYELVVGRYLESQKTIPALLRPGYRIPSIRRTALEAFTEEKGFNKFLTLKEGFIDSFRKTYDETDRQATDEAGNPLDFIPIRFISKQDGAGGRMSTREVSLDVASTALMFIDEMNNHDSLLEIVHDLELAKDVLAKREVAQTKKLPGFQGLLSPERQAIVDDDGYVRTTPGITSNSYKQAKQFIDRLVYGKMKNDEGEITIGKTRIDVAKSVDSLLRYTGIRMMAGNLNVAFSNIATGEVTILKEALGGRWFNMKDWKYGKATFAKEVIPYAGEIGKHKTESKFGAIFELFNPEDQQRGNLHLGKDNSRLKKTTSFKNLNFFNNIGTLEMNGSLMLTLMNKERMKFSSGEEVGLYGALDVRNGIVYLKDGYTKLDGTKFTDADIDKTRNKIITIGQKINGIYNTVDSPGIRAHSIGRLALLMRNWLKPGIDARWRLRYFDERLGVQDEGYYLSALNFFSNMFGKDGWMSQNVANLRYIFGVGLNNYDFLTAEERSNLSQEEQDDLTNLRRSNTKKFLFEVYTIAALSALVMFGWDDDDDKDSIILYHLVRLKRELMTFFSPTEAWSVLRSPTVALDTIEKFSEFVGSVAVGTWTGRSFKDYESGPNKGEMRIWAQLQNKIPVWSQRNQFTDLDKKIDLIDRGWK